VIGEMNANISLLGILKKLNGGKKSIFLLIIILLIIVLEGTCKIATEAISADMIDLGNSIDIKNKKINGDITIINKEINWTIYIEDCEIDGNLILKESEFLKSVSFANTTIRGRSSLEHTVFSDLATFEKSCFMDIANFDYVSFDEARFTKSKFSKDARFMHSTYGKGSSFGNSIFNEDAIFTLSKFKEVDFNRVEFNGKAIFYRVIFRENANFNSAVLSEEADFYNADFQGDADFSDLKASNEIDFSKSNFSQEANFGNIRFNGYANFKNASFESLKLNGAIFNQFYLPWKNVKGKLDCDEYLYLCMINSYKEMGLFDDADDCYYYFKDNYRQSYPFSDCIELILGELYGWGVKPLNTIMWSINFILIFGLYFWFPYILTKPHCAEGKTDIPGDKSSERRLNSSMQSMELHAGKFFNAAKSTCLSLIISSILSARIFASALTSTIDGPSMNGPGRNIAKFEKLLAHLMAFLFLIAVSKTILREII